MKQTKDLILRIHLETINNGSDVHCFPPSGKDACAKNAYRSALRLQLESKQKYDPVNRVL